MPRRTTTIGKGAFGRGISRDFHEWEVVRRIIDRRLPLTVDAVFILMRQILRRNNGIVLKVVRVRLIWPFNHGKNRALQYGVTVQQEVFSDLLPGG